MIRLETLRDLFDYNYWARDRQLDACAALSEEEFLRPMGNSFSSVRDVLAHLIFAEWAWLERWQGKSPTTADRQQVDPDKFPTLNSVRARWSVLEGNMRAHLRGLDEERLSRPLTYTNFSDQVRTYPLGHTMFRLANHQTYHRGQVTTLLRQLGAKAPEVDYLVMLEETIHAQAAGARG